MGKLIAIRVVDMERISIVRHDRVGLILRNAVQVHNAVLQVDLVAGQADAAFDEDEVRLLGVGLVEDDDVAALNGAVVHNGRPLGGWRQRDAVDNQVVADEQRVLHRR